MIRRCCLLALAAALTTATASTTTAAAPPGFKDCGLVSGARWSYHGTSGARYTVISRGVSCALARRLVPGLIRRVATLKTPYAPFTAPDGLTCAATLVQTRAGYCAKPSGARFAWGGKAT